MIDLNKEEIEKKEDQFAIVPKNAVLPAAVLPLLLPCSPRHLVTARPCVRIVASTKARSVDYN